MERNLFGECPKEPRGTRRFFGRHLEYNYDGIKYKGLYQSIVRNGKTVFKGQRDSKLRMDILDLRCNSFLDIGCNIGEFCHYVASLGAEKVLGIEIEESALRFARNTQTNAKFVKADFRDIEKVNIIVDNFFNGKPIDIVFACSIYIESDGKLWDLLKSLKWKTCYVESNPIYKPETKPMLEEIYKLPYKVEYICEYMDPSPKKLWRLTNEI